MMDRKVSFRVAQGCMELIAGGAVIDSFESLGISRDDFDLVTGDSPWIAADRPRVRAVTDALVHGVVDVVGLPRIDVPAEFTAAVMACFVSPRNLMVASRWMEREGPAEAMVEGGSIEAVSASQLFALACQLVGNAPAARKAWERRTNRAIERAVEGE